MKMNIIDNIESFYAFNVYRILKTFLLKFSVYDWFLFSVINSPGIYIRNSKKLQISLGIFHSIGISHNVFYWIFDVYSK